MPQTDVRQAARYLPGEPAAKLKAPTETTPKGEGHAKYQRPLIPCLAAGSLAMLLATRRAPSIVSILAVSWTEVRPLGANASPGEPRL